MSKKVYIVMTEGAQPRSVVSICDSIASGETGDFVIYVFCSRESGVSDVIEENFGENSPVKTVVVGNKIEMYLKAADVVFSSISLFGDSEEPRIYGNTEELNVSFSKSYRSIGSAISAARRFLEARKNR